jgi:hypothetical protein
MLWMMQFGHMQPRRALLTRPAKYLRRLFLSLLEG